MPAEINLLHSKTRYSPEVAVFIGQLRKISYFVIFAVLLTGIGVGFFYFYLQMSLSSLLSQKSQLVTQVNANARKEILYRSLKTELGVAAKVLAAQKTWDGPVKTVLGIAPPPVISSISVTDVGQLSLNIDSDTIENAAGLVGSVISLAGQNKLKDPVLENFGLDKNGRVRMLISFTPVLP